MGSPKRHQGSKFPRNLLAAVIFGVVMYLSRVYSLPFSLGLDSRLAELLFTGAMAALIWWLVSQVEVLIRMWANLVEERRREH